MKKYQAVLFDFDGVIGQTMEDNFQAWAYAFSTINITLKKVEYFLLEGMNTKNVAQTILNKHGQNENLASTIVLLKENHYLEHNSFEFYPNIINFIDSIRENFKLALVTGASSKRLKKTVSDEGFLKKFAITIAGDNVQNPKPDPEPYLLAAKFLNIFPSACLVIENAPLGIESAKKAGMDCVAICSTLKREYLSKADFIIDDTSLLKTLFQEIILI